MVSLKRIVGVIGVVGASVGLAVSGAISQEQTRPPSVEIPAGATALEGVPTVRIESAEGGTTRRVLSKAEAAQNRLVVNIVDGQFYWKSRDNRLLRLNSSGEFTYLSSEPGKYIRITRLNDKLSYVEHVDRRAGHITWWGELRIVGGK